METVQASFTFDAAHRLLDYPGKCSNIHGHTYRVDVEVGLSFCTTPFIMDFSSLKTIMSELLDPWDHALLLAEGDPLIKVLFEERISIRVLAEAPTAEYMSRFLLKSLRTKLLQRECLPRWEDPSSTQFAFAKVSVWETPTNVASSSF